MRQPFSRHRLRHRHALAAIAAATMLAACGGGSSNVADDGGGDGSGGGGGLSDAQRAAAATMTAESNPLCAASALGPYYWEIGDAGGVRASGRVGGADAPTRDSDMLIYSASKWLYAASVVQARGVVEADAPYLNFTSGYSTFGNLPLCVGDTVGDCQLLPIEQDADTVGRFAYDSGHMQRHAAAVMGLDGADNAALALHLVSTIGDYGFSYEVPQPASGVRGSAAGYAAFLRRVLAGDLAMHDALGRHAVCTNPDAPGCNADRTAEASDEDMDYALGHWVEADPAVGDGAYSSAGGGGFYPWIDRSKTTYGILARQNATEGGAGFNSLRCGRLIRQAWMTGDVVNGPLPTPAR
ncbi:MAG: hypothetical protein H6932_06485 [Burkholderiaceae bacterium]|nr:hypothetical protein [Rhodoferax sp.]MCP5270862.1 hypothetical protein [Burkholderiaceae bacterium]